MEPRYSMTAYSVATVVALGLLSARGFPGTAAGIAIGVVAVAAALDASYLVRRRRDRALAHRRRLDLVVRVQWLGIGVAATATATALGRFDFAPLAAAVPIAQTVVIGLTVAAPAVYLSSLVDWYWILPKVSGMAGQAPCERVGGEAFAGVTKIWLFHRAAATAIVTFVLAGVPGYMAANSTDGGEGAAWVIFGSALAIGYNSLNNGLTTAFRYAFDPPRYVGDLVRVRAHPEDSELADAYLVDASIHGMKYKLLSDTDGSDPRFIDKGDRVRMDAVATTPRVRDPVAPCPGVENCRAVNWYCFRNPVAHELKASGDVAPCPWPAREQSGYARAR